MKKDEGQLLPIEELRRGKERFVCGPLHTTMRAEDCVRRQTIARTTEPGQSTYGKCVLCPYGVEVAKNVGAVLPSSASTMRAPTKQECVAVVAEVMAEVSRIGYVKALEVLREAGRDNG